MGEYIYIYIPVIEMRNLLSILMSSHKSMSVITCVLNYSIRDCFNITDNFIALNRLLKHCQ